MSLAFAFVCGCFCVFVGLVFVNDVSMLVGVYVVLVS